VGKSQAPCGVKPNPNVWEPHPFLGPILGTTHGEGKYFKGKEKLKKECPERLLPN